MSIRQSIANPECKETVMLRAVVICPDEEVCGCLKEMLDHVGIVSVARTLSQYPNELNLTRMLRAIGPQIVFLSVESLDRATDVVATMEETAPGIHIVAVSRSRDPHIM